MLVVYQCGSVAVGWHSEQFDLVETIPAQGRKVGLRWSSRFLPTQTVL